MTLHFRKIFGKIHPTFILIPLPYLYKLYISEGKIIQTILLAQSKAKSFFQQ